MEKQKVCIVGGGLTGLITAIALSKLNLKIDLVTGNIEKNLKSNRTVAISQNNYDFLKKLNIFKFHQKEFWPSSKMQLYTIEKKEKFHEIFEIDNKERSKKQILYMIENSKIMQGMFNYVKANSSITLKSKKIISSITSDGLLKSVKYKNSENSKYHLVIICTGHNSDLVKELFHNQSIEKSYEEVSITTTLGHDSIKNNTARQIFSGNEIIAFLPISNKKTSIVWTIKKDAMYKLNKSSMFKKKIKFYAEYFFKNIKFLTTMEQKKVNLLIRQKYYQDRILLFGDSLHVVHPLAGQGLNMILRDLINLEKTLKNKTTLGLDIGSPDVLEEFTKEAKPRNFAYALGIDLIRNTFLFEKKNFKILRNKIISKANKSNFTKDLFYNIADEGLKL